MSERKWTPSQRMAIDYSGSDFLVSAAAGSGKTATMTERIIKNIINGADISRILAVTFTKAAANELKSRISTELAELLKKNPNNAHISSQMVKAGGADICTIDSFCMKIVRPNFDKLSIDSNFRVAEESEIEIIKRDVMNEVLDYFYESPEDNSRFLLVADCYSSLADEDALGEELLSLYKKLISTPDSIKTLLKNTKLDGNFMQCAYGHVLFEHIVRTGKYYCGFFEYAVKEISKDEAGKKSYLQAFLYDLEFAEALKSLKSGAAYNEICDIFASYKPKRLGMIKGDCGLDTEFLKAMRNEFKNVVDKLKKNYFSSDENAIKSAFEQNKKICCAIYDILFIFEEEFQKKKKSYSVCDFNDIERFALELLYNEDGSISETAKEISSRYDEICIDEYQDTNFVQDKIFCAVSSNNRFMVGDIKQSIYRFRSAEPEIFSNYRNTFSPLAPPLAFGEAGKENQTSSDNKNTEEVKRFENESEEKSFTDIGAKSESMGKSIFMSENFRCDKGVIDFVNLISDYMFFNSRSIPYNENDRLIFSKSVPENYSHLKSEICLIEKSESEENDDAFTDGEAVFVAKKIKYLIDNEYLPNGKKICPSDIAILIRGYKNTSAKYINALKKFNVSSEYTGDENFFEKPEILLTLSILNSVDNPSRDIFLAGSLRSHIFGFTIEELIKIRRSENDGVSLYIALKRYCEHNSDSIANKARQFLNKLDEYKRASRKMASHELISFIYEDTGIIAMCSPAERKNLIKLYNHARKYESRAFKGLYSFLKYAEKLSGQNLKEQLGTTDESVKIMSVHAAKGLEFEVCFICNTASKFNITDTASPLLFERHLGVSGYVGRDNGLVKFNTLMRKCAALALKLTNCEEEMRILYVAMTRAKSKLYVTAEIKNASDKYLTALKKSDFTSEYSVYSASSYMDWIINATAKPHEFFKISIINQLNEFSIDEKEEMIENDYTKEELEKYKTLLKHRFDFEYKYKYLEKLPSKLSISKLYPEILDGTENENIGLIPPLSDMPTFLSDKEEDAAAKGTATHVFMQFCDFQKLVNEGAQKELDRLVNMSFVSRETAKLINLEHIENFAHSTLLFDILKAKRVIREFRFNIMLDASEFTNDEKLKNEKILVQGVTDCIYEDENSNLILVDYKTDAVTEKNYIKILKERHSTQLLYYKKACEMMFEKKVAKVLIYSVPLAKTVELDL